VLGLRFTGGSLVIAVVDIVQNWIVQIKTNTESKKRYCTGEVVIMRGK
jgi:hypothetical protein